MLWLVVFLLSGLVLFYNRASILVWALSFTLLLVFFSRFSTASNLEIILSWTLFALVFIPFLFLPLRRKLISQRILNFYLKVMPSMSKTEKEALAAGSVTWEGDLFSGKPNWNKLLTLPKPQLTAEEKAFIDGPLETLCSMIDDWDITHNLSDVPSHIWEFIREQGFFGLIIPKEYGGKAFSAYAHSQILVKLYGISGTVATSISVPNSLGPAELLMRYGTDEQKSYYLPRLASGDEIPCFALTGPSAGSDAGSIPDKGIVCYGEHEGKQVLGIQLNFDKRYITLAPIATVVGLAFKLYDPDHLLGSVENLGITCALIPRHTPNMEIGRRHYPLNIPFQNGPIRGKNVFIPIDFIIGGVRMAGHGWRMLMECLATGRGISLPSSSAGGTKVIAYASGAYARIRKQFNIPISQFEGITEVLTRITANTYVINASRSFVAAAIDDGEHPAIASAIIKYHTTELGRMVANDAMDLHGGKGICLGPNNYIGRGYQSVPIAITVEGANILTRNMIIFGQGAMRCHPYIFKELEAAQMKDVKQRLNSFDKAIIGHAGYTISNFIRSLFLCLTSGFFVVSPKGKLKRYFQHLTRFSAVFALLSDISLITLGGALKRRESISARLGDILSYQYLISTVLKHFIDQGQPKEDLPIIQWISENYFFQLQEKIDDLLNNFPNKITKYILRLFVFPLGKNFRKPNDKLGAQVAKLISSPTETRVRLTEGIYLTPNPNNILGSIENALVKTLAAEPFEKILKDSVQDKLIEGHTLEEKAQCAVKRHFISKKQYDLLIDAHAACNKIIAVDDFDPKELVRNVIFPKETHIDQ